MGFDPEILKQLAQERVESREVNHQIGIMNVIQRLRLQYGDDYKIKFMNNETGSLVAIEFPVIEDGRS